MKCSLIFAKEGVSHVILNAKNMNQKERELLMLVKGSVTIATNMAGRGIDIKLGGEKATKEEAEEIKSRRAFVLGTERHESRRIDNQLRGRSGRQGSRRDTILCIS